MEENPDFSSYDYETLIDVYEHIEERQYPERKNAVKDLLEERRNAPETIEQQNERLKEKRYDTFFQRLAAHLLDGLILWVPSSIFTAIILVSPSLVAMLVAIVGELLLLGYYIVLHWQTGQTIGKKVLLVRVVSNDGEGGISLRQAIVRESLPIAVIGIVGLVSFLTPEIHSREGLALGEPSRFQSIAGATMLVWAALELITMLFHGRHRALQDLLSGTVVVNELPPE